MSFLERGRFCSRHEFATHESSRVTSGDVVAGDTYTAMMRLDDEDKEAALLPVQVIARTQKTGLTVVRLAFMDKEGNHIVESEGCMSDGYLSEFKNSPVIVRNTQTDQQYGIVTSYLRDPWTEFLHLSMAESASLSMPVRQLVDA